MYWMTVLVFNSLKRSLTHFEFSALPGLCGPDTRLTQVEEETTGKSHLDSLAGLDLASL